MTASERRVLRLLMARTAALANERGDMLLTYPDARTVPLATDALGLRPSPKLLAAITSGRPTLDTIHHCDALALLRALPDASVDLVVTSPPYDNLRAYKGYSWDFERIARETYRVLKTGGVLVWVVGDSVEDYSENLTSAEQKIYFRRAVGFHIHDTMIWHNPGTKFADPTRYYNSFQYMFVLSKGRPKTVNLLTAPNKTAGETRPPGSLVKKQEPDGSVTYRVRKPTKEFGVLGNVWSMGTGYMVSSVDDCAFEHPAIFPEELARRHILTWSNPGDVVLDYFGGSGTTAKVARSLGRRYITCDIAAEYVDLMKRRLSQPFTPPLLTADAALAGQAPAAGQAQMALAF